MTRPQRSLRTSRRPVNSSSQHWTLSPKRLTRRCRASPRLGTSTPASLGWASCPRHVCLTETGDDATHFADARGLTACWGRPGHTCQWQETRDAPLQGREPSPGRLSANLWTFAALRLSTGARAHDDRRCVAGDRHAAAQHHLFNRLLGCFYYWLQTGQAHAEDLALPTAQPIAARQAMFLGCLGCTRTSLAMRTGVPYGCLNDVREREVTCLYGHDSTHHHAATRRRLGHTLVCA